MTIDQAGALDLADIDFTEQHLPDGWQPDIVDADPDLADVRDDDKDSDE